MASQRAAIVGRGWEFPIRRSPTLIGMSDRIRQSIWIILATAQGERVMRPDFGCGIHDLVHQVNTATVRATVAQKAHEALVRWEPRIDVIEVTAESPSDLGTEIRISIHYRIRGNNAASNLVYPFFLREGNG